MKTLIIVLIFFTLIYGLGLVDENKRKNVKKYTVELTYYDSCNQKDTLEIIDCDEPNNSSINNWNVAVTSYTTCQGKQYFNIKNIRIIKTE